ncbi:hypothetical protein [Streptomyces sp. ITFR-6]|uniref:hypothetical protein n=1 Tax=Streptomyces sp. ITFR-6 TaxID=3075197 RepID=UPI00288AA072|nr:hypothetical protein [Streptomyces sp. ITFR-6]WNI27635.1 hypothetical protein RLT59_01740 [Streptomyces sp. ITFR-6]
MNDVHSNGRGSGADPIPRDPPDQQAGADEDPLDVVGGTKRRTADERPDPGVPDTDEAGTGRRGASQAGYRPHPEHPVPDEPSG